MRQLKNVIEIIKNKCKENNYVLVNEFNYVNIDTKFFIKCVKCNHIFSTSYRNFILKNRNCNECAKLFRSNKLKNTNVLNVLREIEKNRNVKIEIDNYKNCKMLLTIKCDKCNHEWKASYSNLVYKKSSCPKCTNNVKLTDDYVLSKVREKCLLNNFSIKNIKYNGSFSILNIECNRCKSLWECNYNNFINNNTNCPICNESKLEKETAQLLDENHITYERQKRFKWLGRQSLDFYLPDYNIGIECQGRQHFEPVEYFGGEKEFKRILDRDKRKLMLCETNNIKLLYYSYHDIKQDEIIYNNKKLISLLK